TKPVTRDFSNNKITGLRVIIAAIADATKQKNTKNPKASNVRDTIPLIITIINGGTPAAARA
ncbi:unnamed protein product, partial [Rotaria magnacalcarata]